MGMDALRDYQAEGNRKVLAAMQTGNTIGVGPTGSGKGTMIAHLAAHLAGSGKRVVVLAHRREIVLDLCGRIRALFPFTGAILPGERISPRARVQVVSTQSMLSLAMPKCDAVVIDECHHYVADEWRALVASVGDDVPLVGYTATPERADGRPMGGLFKHMIKFVGYGELISRGLIVPCDVLRPDGPTGIDLAQDPVDAYIKHASGSSAFLFTRDVKSARQYVRELSSRGVPSAVISNSTPTARRRMHLEALEAGTIKVIANAFTMTEGIDIPRVSTVILARNTQFVGAYMQMCGRALRAYPGKKCALLIDLHGVSHDLGMPTQDRDFELGEGDEPGDGQSSSLQPGSMSLARDPMVLGLPLEMAASTCAPFVAGDHAGTSKKTGKPSPRDYWRALRAEVRRGVITQDEARHAYLSQYGRVTKNAKKQKPVRAA